MNPDEIWSLFWESSIDIGLFLTCLFVSSFFSGAETAITSIGIHKSKQKLEEDGVKAFELQVLNLWIDSPGTIITTILVANNVANILATAIITKIAIQYSQNYGVGIATGLATFIILLFGEVIPKSYAKANADRIGFTALKIVGIFYSILKPIAWPLSKVAERLIKSLGGVENSIRPSITEKDLEFLVEQSRSEGTLKEFKTEMIHGVFDFDETIVREIMTPRTNVLGVSEDSSFSDVAAACIESGFSRVPVYKESLDNITGLIFAKDILKYSAKTNGDNESFSTSELSRDVLHILETKPIVDVFRELKREKSHFAVVIDEHGGTAGIVTLEDILEEIVGEIQDEFDVEEAKILKIDTSTFDVAGNVHIQEFMEYFELNGSFMERISDLDVDTLGGFMSHEMGQIPEVGQKTIVGNLSLEVAEVDKKRIERMRVIKHPPLNNDQANQSTPSSKH